MSRFACDSMLICGASSSVGSNNRPFWANRELPCRSCTERKRFFCCDSRATSAPVACSTSSGVGASITAMIVSNCGKAFSNVSSRCRLGLLLEMS